MDANPIVLDESADDVVVVLVEGEHDIYTAPTLRERLDEALERGGGVVVDLTAATFVDSSVLGALLEPGGVHSTPIKGMSSAWANSRTGSAADPRHHRAGPRAAGPGRSRQAIEHARAGVRG
jgi:hypothetical protein